MDFEDIQKKYINNNKRMSNINSYYSGKYELQKKILKELALFLFIIILVIVIGNFILPKNTVRYIVIFIAVVAIIRALMKSYDLIIRDTNNINQYIFDKGSNYVSTPEIAKLSNSNSNGVIASGATPDYSWSEGRIADYSKYLTEEKFNRNSNESYDKWADRCDGHNKLLIEDTCITSNYPGPIQQWKNIKKNGVGNDNMRKIRNKAFVNINDFDWSDSIKAIHSLTDSNGEKLAKDGNLNYYVNQSTKDFCGKTCNAEEEYGQFNCSILCKDGDYGIDESLLNDPVYDIRACSSDSEYHNIADVLKGQSWENTDKNGQKIWEEAKEKGDSKMYGCGEIEEWDANREQNKLFNYCKLKCGYDMAKCYKDKSVITEKLPTTRKQCAERCNRVIPLHAIPRLKSKDLLDINAELIPPLHNNDSSLSDWGVITASNNWDQYRKNYNY